MNDDRITRRSHANTQNEANHTSLTPVYSEPYFNIRINLIRNKCPRAFLSVIVNMAHL